MRNIQEVFDQIRQVQKEEYSLREMYKDALSNDTQYQEIIEELKVLKEKKKKIEQETQAQLGNQFVQMESLKQSIRNSKQMLSDIALSNLMDGNSIEVKDEYNNFYEPKFNVSFKKTSAQNNFEQQQ
jgi:sugar diacid utilization regulator